MPLTIADVMTAPVFSLSPDATLLDAHNVTRDKGIRHLPIIEPQTNQLVGIVTQKLLISRVIALLTKFGNDSLQSEEAKVNIMDIALKEFDTVSVDQSVAEVASFFLKNKHGCMPVVDEEAHVVGILTSSDFVKLTIKLLDGSKSLFD
ncbi:CBS domain-containing protein [Alteromonas sediminis]|uniref:CBS domain-containing protein n=1 Tax=Alteromonas sediminis TaxID=2259342 RepID=A0A3N5ZAW5_9ALTE|nr:CBS domain-containing protein [Alteromonas sediminis]RPJ66728.1 CBS domain-containing protein [Alteromonas sediminis]